MDAREPLGHTLEIYQGDPALRAFLALVERAAVGWEAGADRCGNSARRDVESSRRHHPTRVDAGGRPRRTSQAIRMEKDLKRRDLA